MGLLVTCALEESLTSFLVHADLGLSDVACSFVGFHPDLAGWPGWVIRIVEAA